MAILYNELKLKYAKSSYQEAYKLQKETYRKIKERNIKYKHDLSVHGGSVVGGEGDTSSQSEEEEKPPQAYSRQQSVAYSAFGDETLMDQRNEL